MKLLDEYFEIQQKIYDYFGYEEDWQVIPLEDRRDYLWYADSNEVVYAKQMKDFEIHRGEYYSDEIYKYLLQYIYETKDYTMIIIDTHTDGNKFLAIYDNSKKLKANPKDEF